MPDIGQAYSSATDSQDMLLEDLHDDGDEEEDPFLAHMEEMEALLEARRQEMRLRSENLFARLEEIQDEQDATHARQLAQLNRLEDDLMTLLLQGSQSTVDDVVRSAEEYDTSAKASGMQSDLLLMLRDELHTLSQSSLLPGVDGQQQRVQMEEQSDSDIEDDLEEEEEDEEEECQDEDEIEEDDEELEQDDRNEGEQLDMGQKPAHAESSAIPSMPSLFIAPKSQVIDVAQPFPVLEAQLEGVFRQNSRLRAEFSAMQEMIQGDDNVLSAAVTNASVLEMLRRQSAQLALMRQTLASMELGHPHSECATGDAGTATKDATEEDNATPETKLFQVITQTEELQAKHSQLTQQNGELEEELEALQEQQDMLNQLATLTLALH